MTNFNVILFNNFETLDVFGPIEVIGKLGKHYEIECFSEKGGIITSSQNIRVETLPISDINRDGILLIPGGFGTRSEVNNKELIRYIKDLSLCAKFVLTVCTGSALLASTGLLKGIMATTNKMAFDWVIEQDKDVQWIRKARWVKDGKYYTSSGVSAGIDMALGFIADTMGTEVAEKISQGIEYVWNRDKDSDLFC
ncbi:dimethyladenosine transferase [Candidatus Formimonas warabiya]|uniref:Dimethyladenosine transferase n=2 Tax=Formimonas warabiya TaxID=1761012 RepID=A0A3G1KRN2_FORW1|nr:DJ-1/PfpI family protein [Candidatus Formimonas warabiya]ATW25106.1 dimethyladenosine transferase [Candidatus Formimonas warabiya]